VTRLHSAKQIARHAKLVSAAPTVLKLGGELLEDEAQLARLARAIAKAAQSTPLVLVHGGGREIDQALMAAGIPKQQVDGLRVTDAATLRVVVSVLAGTVNTRFVAAVNAAGGRAVGLTGADAGVAPVRQARPHRAASGKTVDLGLVGQPVDAPPPALLNSMLRDRFVPIIACIGASRKGQLLNVNADTLAASLAGRVGARRLVIAGGTAGVLDERGDTIPALQRGAVAAMVASGTASAGMVAKLAACVAARKAGVEDVFVTSGREPSALAALVAGRPARTSTFTRVV
jgi:acetylglutamate kinase